MTGPNPPDYEQTPEQPKTGDTRSTTLLWRWLFVIGLIALACFGYGVSRVGGWL